MKLSFVTSRNREGDVREFVFKPEESFQWKAGQYLHYTLPHDHPDDRGITRWFTISAAPSEHEVRITTHINHERSSSFKQALQALQPGDEVQVDAPEGDFTLDDLSRNYIFIAGGIGITPVRSILTEAAAKGQYPHTTLLYANRDEQVVFRDELTHLQQDNPNLKIDYIIGPKRINKDTVKAAVDAVEDPLVYVSGPEPMVMAMKEQLQAIGVNDDHIRADDFPGYKRI